MNVLHYAGIRENMSSGVSVIVPEIVNAQSELMNVCFYNYGESSFEISNNILALDRQSNDDYHKFSPPFNKPDIVIFHSPYGIKMSLHISAMLRKEKIPYIIVPHGCFSAEALKKKKIKKWIANKIFFRKMFQGASAIQFLSIGEREASIYKEKGIIVPNAVQLPMDVTRNENRVGTQIAFVGRKDIYHKGLDLLIKACGNIRDELRKKDVHVYLYGPYENNNEAELKALISENGLDDIVYDCNPIYGKEKENVFLKTDVIALTSRYEGLPGIVLEAWAYGCPTLLTPGSNMAEEAVENNCGWKAEASATDIARVIMEIVKKPDYIREKSNCAFHYVREKYRWPVIAQKYADEYKIIIGRN